MSLQSHNSVCVCVYTQITHTHRHQYEDDCGLFTTPLPSMQMSSMAPYCFACLCNARIIAVVEHVD